MDIEKLAIECGAQIEKTIGTTYYTLDADDLTTFAKAYLNEWLKEQEVVGYMSRNGNAVGIENKKWVVGYDTPLIAIPSEVK